MKETALTHPKMRKLARLLQLDLFSAVGLMEMLWTWATRNVPAGDVGKFEDLDIEEAVFWPAAKSGKLIPALLEAGWLDAHNEHRLLIHDWADHCQDYVHRGLWRSRRLFASGEAPNPSMSGLANQAERDAYRVWREALMVQPVVIDQKTMVSGANTTINEGSKGGSHATPRHATPCLANSGVSDVREDIPPPDPDPEPEPPPPAPRGKPEIQTTRTGGRIVGLSRPGPLKFVKGSQSRGRPLDETELAFAQDVHQAFDGRLGDPSHDPDLVRRLKRAADAMGRERYLDSMRKIVRQRKHRQAEGWGLIVTILETDARKPSGYG